MAHKHCAKRGPYQRPVSARNRPRRSCRTRTPFRPESELYVDDASVAEDCRRSPSCSLFPSGGVSFTGGGVARLAAAPTLAQSRRTTQRVPRRTTSRRDRPATYASSISRLDCGWEISPRRRNRAPSRSLANRGDWHHSSSGRAVSPRPRSRMTQARPRTAEAPSRPMPVV